MLVLRDDVNTYCTHVNPVLQGGMAKNTKANTGGRAETRPLRIRAAQTVAMIDLVGREGIVEFVHVAIDNEIKRRMAAAHRAAARDAKRKGGKR